MKFENCDLLRCKYCDSNLVNMIATKIKHDEYENRDISIQKNYLTIKDLQAIKIFLRCYNCSKVSELLLKNQRGCSSLQLLKHGEDQEPRNEIISIQQRIF